MFNDDNAVVVFSQMYVDGLMHFYDTISSTSQFTIIADNDHISWSRIQYFNRAAKRCERCKRCSCKDFPTGVKILVENVMKGGVKHLKCL